MFNLTLRYTAMLSISFLISGCPGDEDTTPLDPGNHYQQTCACAYTASSSAGTNEGVISETAYTCSNGAPNADVGNRACGPRSVPANRMAQQMFPTSTISNVSCSSSSNRSTGRSCSIEKNTDPGDGVASIENPLVSGTNDILLWDPSGAVLGESNSANLTGSIRDSSISASVKFLRWRTGSTKAKGKVQLDRPVCRSNQNCPIILRYMELDIDDFDIHRPVVRNARLRNAQLYTLNNYKSEIERDGKFRFKNVQVVVSATVNGQARNFKYTIDSDVVGRISNFQGSGPVAPAVIDFWFDANNSSMRLKSKVTFRVDRSEVRIRSASTRRCLRGRPGDRRPIRATVEVCTNPTVSQSWSLEAKNANYKIRQPAFNSCLNVKSGSQNFDGGHVEVAGCSNHSDQLWELLPGSKLRHKTTRRCLNIRAGSQNRNGGNVEISGCSNHLDQRWTLLNPLY